jgi:hypothetical protein
MKSLFATLICRIAAFVFPPACLAQLTHCFPAALRAALFAAEGALQFGDMFLAGRVDAGQ